MTNYNQPITPNDENTSSFDENTNSIQIDWYKEQH